MGGSQHGKPALPSRCPDSLVPDLQEAKDIGDEFLALEKFVNLNYLVRISWLPTSHPQRMKRCTWLWKASALCTWHVCAMKCQCTALQQ